MFSLLLAATGPWFQPLVWMDYRLSVLLTISIPLVVLIWAVFASSDAIARLLMIYWRVASLLAITLYLMMAALPVSFVSSVMGRALIPACLWFWEDLNDEIADRPQSSLKLAFTAWRWAITVYSGLGALAQIPFLTCAFKSQIQVIDEPFCSVWFDPPWLYKQMFHAKASPQFLGFLGLTGLAIYVVYLSYFVLIRLGKQGRSATGN
ncbi:MAG: DUF3177 family protein [Microcoleus sp. PH2017_29_MFU_D_A]|uniref:DUF3177 family protein n=1 Tax=unclassified Microcoleus TaxID=2642155 RepID=UPI001E0D5158|nr:MULTISPECIES: DUF3177 family protein [unclassified Microcoleus]MCC3417051.1 DUF3177 family protein [Microcoleus sp. PH2017_07_MST_O_A]MCC3464773.1 DUF3177 family protein [Microcoleus sp. PH2017_06_SFM_O_A]MCC3501451.1 DUF3177 family protein [Microcoleus sp. PH2017_19_SFW_U_A]TAE12895.1 MAG: DUF3177 family protein [Oscillatoriales cyanobacterium]MCC3423008.1 DUF3177 family protein [Microcoleus sp. PH2017_01_SCD_O_A]